MESFFSINNCKSRKKVTESFSSIKNFKSRKAVMEFFLTFSSFKSRKKETEFFFSGHASLSFHMLHRFPGTIFSLSFPSEILWLYISLTIYFDLHEERCRAHFSKYCKSYFPTTPINSFKYIMSEATVPSFASYSCLEHFQKYRRKSSYVSNELRWNFTFNWIFCVYSFRLIISLGIKTANW